MKPEDFRPGKQYRWLGRLYHVRAIVDDYYMVVRWWSRRRRDWIYEVEEIEIMAITLTMNKQPKQVAE